MRDYFASLDLLLERDDDVYLPGHGPPLREPRSLVRGMLAHRRLREQAIVHKLTEGPADHTKAKYAFVYGDFRRLHRIGIIACLYRAAEWRHKAVERAAYDLLQVLDDASS